MSKHQVKTMLREMQNRGSITKEEADQIMSCIQPSWIKSVRTRVPTLSKHHVLSNELVGFNQALIRVVIYRGLMPPRDQLGIVRYRKEMSEVEKLRFAEQFVESPLAHYLVRMNYPFGHWNEVLDSPNFDYICEYLFVGTKLSKREARCARGPISITEVTKKTAIDPYAIRTETAASVMSQSLSQTQTEVLEPISLSTKEFSVQSAEAEPLEKATVKSAHAEKATPQLVLIPPGSLNIRGIEAVPTVVSQPVIKQHKPQENSYTSHEENLEELKGLFESIDASDLIQNLMEDKELRKVYRSLTDDD